MRRTFRRWVLGLGIAVGGVSPCLAQDVTPTAGTACCQSPAVGPIASCFRFPLFPLFRPRPAPPSPAAPSPTTPSPTDQRPDAPRPDPAVDPNAMANLGSGQFPGAGTDPSGPALNDRTLGDSFGGSGGQSVVPVSMPGRLTGPGSVTFPNVNSTTFPLPVTKFAVLPATVSAGGLSGTVSTLSGLPGGNSNFDAILKQPTFPVPSTIVTPTTTAIINALTNKTLPASLGLPIPAGTPSPVFYAAQMAEQHFNPAAVLQSLTIVPTSVSPLSNGPVVFNGNFTSVIQVPTSINVPNPGNGGVVGRQKMSEDANPIPMDRVFFDYDYFGHADLGNGQDVNRCVFGFEKTFFNGLASLEVRLPFASTMSSDIVVGTQATRVELGDLRVTPRLLLWDGPEVHVGAGLGIFLPTASATNVAGADGTPLVRIANRSVGLSPYLGVLLTPNDRLFVQGWVTCDFDPNGDPVQVNADGSGLQNVGRLQNAANLQLDGQLGYWIYRDYSSPLITGFAPIIELHYGTSVQNADSVSSGGFIIGDPSNPAAQLNLTTGFLASVGRRSTITVGVVVPLIQEDRNFNVQFGLRANFLFGPRAAEPRPTTF